MQTACPLLPRSTRPPPGLPAADRPSPRCGRGNQHWSPQTTHANRTPSVPRSQPRPPAAGAQHRLMRMPCPAPRLQYRASNVEHPVSSPQHPTSSIDPTALQALSNNPVLACLLIAGTLMAASTVSAAEPQPYIVREVAQGSIDIDGYLGKTEWPAQAWTTAFTFPWQEREAPRTEMCCVTSGDRLQFAFQCVDPDVVVVGQQPEVELSVAGGDRIEIYFARDADLREYYCLEVSPAGQVLDYKATFPREFDDSWNWPGLEVAGRTGPAGYVVEGSLPLSSLTELTGFTRSDDRGVLVGAFRAEFSHSDGKRPKMEWISWIRPDTEGPNFHTPSAFGRFHFQP